MKSLKITALIAVAFAAVGCSSGPVSTVNSASDIASLRSDIAEVKQIAMQANENASLARQLSQENSAKINQVFRKSLRK